MTRKQIAIIGGGPAGLLAADVLSPSHEVHIYEKEKSVGQKFLVAGKGGFNITNGLKRNELAAKYSPEYFLKEALTMVKIKYFLLSIALFLANNAVSQHHFIKEIFPDSIIHLKKGIYLNINEFMMNNPGISWDFEVINDNPDYVVYPEEKNVFYVSYYDVVGNKIQKELSEIWGFYDGYGVFINFKGKPYELIYLGAISILRYEHFYKKNIYSQMVGISPVVGVQKIKDIFLHLKTNIIIPATDINFERLIENDKDFFDTYKKE